VSFVIPAVKTDRGDNILNSEWSVGSGGRYPGVGTEFSYQRGVANCPGECITSPGPTDRQVVVQVRFNSMLHNQQLVRWCQYNVKSRS
jgi:hypothetical protein